MQPSIAKKKKFIEVFEPTMTSLGFFSRGNVFYKIVPEQGFMMKLSFDLRRWGCFNEIFLTGGSLYSPIVLESNGREAEGGCGIWLTQCWRYFLGEEVFRQKATEMRPDLCGFSLDEVERCLRYFLTVFEEHFVPMLQNLNTLRDYLAVEEQMVTLMSNYSERNDVPDAARETVLGYLSLGDLDNAKRTAQARVASEKAWIEQIPHYKDVNPYVTEDTLQDMAQWAQNRLLPKQKLADQLEAGDLDDLYREMAELKAASTEACQTFFKRRRKTQMEQIK